MKQIINLSSLILIRGDTFESNEVHSIGNWRGKFGQMPEFWFPAQ